MFVFFFFVSFWNCIQRTQWPPLRKRKNNSCAINVHKNGWWTTRASKLAFHWAGTMAIDPCASKKKKKRRSSGHKMKKQLLFHSVSWTGTKVQNYRKRHWHRQLRVRKKKSNNKWIKKWVVIRWSSTRVRWRFHSSPNEGDSNENHGICGRNS